MMKDRIGRQEVLLQINRQYDYIWETHKAFSLNALNIERLLIKSVPMVIWVLSYLGIVLSMPLFLDTSVPLSILDSSVRFRF